MWYTHSGGRRFNSGGEQFELDRRPRAIGLHETEGNRPDGFQKRRWNRTNL